MYSQASVMLGNSRDSTACVIKRSEKWLLGSTGHTRLNQAVKTNERTYMQWGWRLFKFAIKRVVIVVSPGKNQVRFQIAPITSKGITTRNNNCAIQGKAEPTISQAAMFGPSCV